MVYRSSRPEAFLGKDVPKICSKFTGEYSCRSVISIKLQSNFIEINLRYGCSPANLLHIFGTPFPNNKCEEVLLGVLNHSRKKRKDSLKTRAVLIWISMLCWNLPNGPKHRGSLQKKWWILLLLTLTSINVLQSKWMPRPLKILYIILRLFLLNQSSYVYCRLARLTGAFKITLI